MTERLSLELIDVRIKQPDNDLITIFTSFEHNWNACVPNVIVVADNMTDVNCLQLKNAFSPMVVTEGKLIDVNKELSKAPAPMIVTFGILTLVIPEELKAELPMLVTVLGRVSVFNSGQLLKRLLLIVVNAFGRVTVVKTVQLKNALSPMLVTESGITTDVNAVRSLNADAAMLVTLYVAPPTTKLDNKVMLPEADALVPTLADTVPTV